MKVIIKEDAIEKGLKRFYTGEPCNHGHYSERNVIGGACRECQIIRRNRPEEKAKMKVYTRKSYVKNKDEVLERTKKYYEENKDKCKGLSRKNYLKNKEKVNERTREYYQENREFLLEYNKIWTKENRERINRYCRERYQNDPTFRVGRLIKRSVRRLIEDMGGNKERSTFDLVGYAPEQLKESLESKWIEGMSWENYGEWHIDHKYPLHLHLQDGVTDPAIINHLDNLIPMWKEDNLSKNKLNLPDWLEKKGVNSDEYLRYQKLL